jgi:hypothetical protein
MHDVLGALCRGRPSQRRFELHGLEVGCLLVDDVPCEVEQFLCDIHILDVIEILVLVAYLVRLA